MVSLQQHAARLGKAQARRERRKLAAAARRARCFLSRSGGVLPRAIFMTDPLRTPDPLAIASRLPASWGVIYRHFGDANRIKIGEALARLCRRRGVMLLVSADPELARRIGADGVHWPEQRLHQRRSRKFGGIETASAHSRRALAAARAMGIDAAILSSVFASRSATAFAPIGVLGWRQIAKASPLPVYGLGGVTAETAGRMFNGSTSQIAGWAAVEAIVSAWGDGADV